MNYNIVSIRECPEYLDRTVQYFSSNWGVPYDVYHDCISHSISTESPLPRWYLLINENDKIVGCFGLDGEPGRIYEADTDIHTKKMISTRLIWWMNEWYTARSIQIPGDAKGNAPYKTWHDFISDIYNEIGYDINWVNNRLDEIIKHGLWYLTKSPDFHQFRQQWTLSRSQN